VRRLTLLIAVFAFALTACASSGEGDPVTSPPAGNDATTSVAESSADSTIATDDDGTTTTTAPPETTATTSGRPLAPDFTLDLGEGGTYTLSEGERPVYLVFWAEW
jgi:ABC-type enterochelin transport system substrate-binding protein